MGRKAGATMDGLPSSSSSWAAFIAVIKRRWLGGDAGEDAIVICIILVICGLLGFCGVGRRNLWPQIHLRSS